MTSTKKHITTALTAAILATTFTIPATTAETPTVRVSSYKGSALEVGERSGLIIGPSGTDYTVISSNPDTVAVEQVLTFWVAVAKAEGTAEITASNSAGKHGSVTLTVGPASAASEPPASGDSVGLTDNMEIRQEMIRLINQTRKDNGGGGAAGQRGPDECRPNLLQPALHLASRSGGEPGRCRRRLPLRLRVQPHRVHWHSRCRPTRRRQLDQLPRSLRDHDRPQMRLHRCRRDPVRRHHLLLHVRRNTQQRQLLCISE